MRRRVGWVKRADRIPVYLDGWIRIGKGERHSVIVTDLSSDGCKVRLRQMLPIGETVELDVGQQKFEASVRWSVLGAAGLRYLQIDGQMSGSG